MPIQSVETIIVFLADAFLSFSSIDPISFSKIRIRFDSFLFTPK
jgi:hypothetical protein